MENTTTQMVKKLIGGDSDVWTQFLFNIEMAKQISNIDNNMAQALLGAGVAWTGGGWTTGSASKKLWETVKIPLVVQDFKEYLHVWLFTLALYWGIEVPALTLSGPAADASFQLLELLNTSHMEGDPPEQPDTSIDGLPWEEQLEELPKELLYLLQKASAGDRLDLSETLKDVPRWAGLPSRAPDNNHRQSKADRDLKSIQQSLLQGLRLLAWAYCSDSDVTPWQVAWKHLADTFYKVEFLRKELGMPGSTPTGKEVLYSKEDLAQASFNSKVRTYRTFRSVSGSGEPPLPQCSFRDPVHSSGIRSPQKGAGKGKGKSNNYHYAPAGYKPAFGRGNFGYTRHGAKGKV